MTSVTDPLGQVTSFLFHEGCRRTSITDAKGHITRFEFDRLGRQTKRPLPMGPDATQSFDVMGKVVSRTDRNGRPSSFVFDQQSRMVARTIPGRGTESFTYDADGRRLTAGGESFSHDPRGRLMSNTKLDGEVLVYEHDASGNRTAIHGPHGTTRYSFDALNRVETVIDPSGGLTTYGYTASGQVETVALPNGVVTTYSRDVLDHLTGIETVNAGNHLLAAYVYTPSPMGRQTSVVEAHTGRTVLWSYDPNGRLIEEAITDLINGDRVLAYSLDAVGNRTSKVDSVDGATSYTFDDNDRLLSEAGPSGLATYGFDNNGNVISKTDASGTTSYTFDARNLLVNAGGPGLVASYEYDADGARTAKLVNGVRTNHLVEHGFAHAQVLRETDAAGVEVAHHVFGAEELLSSVRPGEGARYMLYDAQRSVRQLSDATGAVVDDYVFDAWGVEIASGGASANTYRYSGEQAD